MYIGAAKECKEYCQQNSSTAFQRLHAKQKHMILGLKEFSQENDEYIFKIQKAWHYFDNEIQKFFATLRKKIDTIQSQAKQRVKQQELKIAVNSNDKRLIELSRDIFNQKFQKLTCKEINEFIQIKNSLTKNNNFPQISSKQQSFAYDIMDEVKKAVYEIGKKLTQVRKEQRFDRRQVRNNNEHYRQDKIEDRRQNGNRDNRQFHNKKEKIEITPQQDRRQGRQVRQKITRQGRDERRPRQDRQDRRPRQDRGDRRPRQDRDQRRPREDRDQRKPRQDRQQNVRRQGRQQRRPRQDRDERKPRQGRQDRKPIQDKGERKPRQQRERRGQHREREDNRQRRHQHKNHKEKSTKQYPKLKIIELKSDSDEFSIDLKMINLVKVVGDRDVWKVKDETGEIKLVIPNHQSFKLGTSITLNNAYVKEYGKQLQIVAKLYSTITSAQLGNNIDVGSLNKNKRRRPRPKPTGKSYPNFVKIDSLQPDVQDFKMIAKVISVRKNGQYIDCVIGDETGIVNARFRSGAQFLKENNTIYCRGLDVAITQSGNILVTEGKKLLIENGRDPIRKTKEQNNVSEREYEPADD